MFEIDNHSRTALLGRQIIQHQAAGAHGADVGTPTVFSDLLFRCRQSVLGLRRIERTALSAVVTRFQREN
jgi:hypothetical protein